MNYFTKISIIALGETGSGKSLFCKLFSKSEIFVSKDDTESVTREINSITFKNEKKMTEIFLIDTPGSNDSRGAQQDIENLRLTQEFISQQQRINCIIIVMNIQSTRLTDSIKQTIRNICQCFPLPDFWDHVIFVWTHCKFDNENEEKRLKNKIETQFKKSFITLSEEIEKSFHINKIQPDQIINNIYNEFNEYITDEKILEKNYARSEENFEKIIDLVKNMNPLYEIVFPPEEKDVLQEPKEGRMVGNIRQFTYNKIRIRKYKDFNKPEIIQNEEIYGKFVLSMHEKESNWELSENEQNNKKYIKYLIRTFYNDEGKEFDPIDINIPLKEKLREKRVETQQREEIINNNRKKIYQVDLVFYPDTSERTEENKIYIKEIEEGETDWEIDKNFNQNNIIKYNKYKTRTEFDIDGNKIGNTKIDKENIVDWKKIETLIEDNVRIIITDKITKVVKKTTKTETKKSDENPRIIYKNVEEIAIEEIKEDFEQINNLDNNNLGTIEYNYYNVKFINNVKIENEKTKIDSKSYVETYKQSNEQKTLREKRDEYEYKIIYNEIYMIDSRFPTVKRNTGYKIILDEKIVNLIKENEVEERFDNNNVIKQKYNVYYLINSEGNKVEDHREKNGKEIVEKIEYGDEYAIISEPMTLERINELKTEKIYPISYVNIYYRDELNTLRKERKKVRIENVEIKLEQNRYITKNIPDKYIIINYEYNELIFIDGVHTKTIPNHNEKRFDLLVKIKEEECFERIDANEVIKMKTEIWYYIDEDNNEKIVDTQITQDKEEIKYGDEYFEIEAPMTIESINELKKEKKYPIHYTKVYYKKEINTERKEIKKVRTENVSIIMDHKTYNKKNIEEKYIIIYDVYKELFYINGTISKEIPNNYEKRYNLLIREENNKREEKDHIVKTKTKIYYYVDENNKEIEVDKIFQEENEEIKYGKEYSEIENPMTLEKINQLKYEKKYPINYVNIYYQDELNTIRKGRKRIRTEKIEIKITNKKIDSSIIDDYKKIIIKEYHTESIFINEKLQKEVTILLNEKKYDLFKKQKIEQKDGAYNILKTITDIVYYINDNNQEIEVKKNIKNETENIFYGEEYSEIESPMSQEKIAKLKSEKKYPIIYRKIYYKEEINTERKYKIRTKTEQIELNLEHKKETFPTDDNAIIRVKEYDVEKMFINGRINKISDQLNPKDYTESNILEKYEYTDKVKIKDVEHTFSKDEHHFNIYKVTEIIYRNGKRETIRSFKESIVERYG